MEQQRRDTVLRGALEQLAEQGYEQMSLESACKEAGLSPEEFRDEFGGKDEFLFAAYDRVTDHVVERASSRCVDSEPWPERVRVGLEALLAAIAAEPRMTLAMTRAFPGIRPSAYERYVALLGRFVPFMHEGREYSEVDEELPGEVELLAVGAAEAIIFGEIEAGRAAMLPKMLPEILFSVLVPFMGPERAADEMRTAAAAS